MKKTMNKALLTTTGMVGAVACVGLALTSSPTSADVVDEINVVVPSSCSLSGTNLLHTADVRNDIYTSNIGSANIKATCNDTAGFAIYAIGYTNNEYGNNKMHSGTVSSDYDIPTGKYVQGTTTDSVWSMKLAPVTGTYAPTIRNDSTYNFTDYELVPDTYTKVASYNEITDSGDGSTGSNFTTTYANYMSKTQPGGVYTGQVKFTIVHPSSAAAPVTPPAPISQCPTKVPGITYMQDLNSSNTATIMSNMTEYEQYYLRDARDEEPYCVSKIANTIWMTQNLRITGVVPAEGSNFNTYSSVNVCEGDLTAGNSWEQPRCHDSGNTTYGVWYNYAAASAKTTIGDGNNTPTTEDICPTGWTLPTYDTNKPADSINIFIEADPTISTAFSPITGGHYGGGYISDVSYGCWWSKKASSTTGRYRLEYKSSDGSLDAGKSNRNLGYYIRCVKTST